MPVCLIRQQAAKLASNTDWKCGGNSFVGFLQPHRDDKNPESCLTFIAYIADERCFPLFPVLMLSQANWRVVSVFFIQLRNVKRYLGK